MFLAAYFYAILLWVPLLGLFFAAGRGSARWFLVPPIALAMVVSAWEAMVPAQVNIRLDLFLSAPAMGLLDALAGVLIAGSLYVRRRARQPASVPLGVAAALCLAAPIALTTGWIQADRENQAQTRGFEASFRDDAAQREAYGELRGSAFAGYYAVENPSTEYARLIVNSAGDLVLYSPEYYRQAAHGAPDPIDAKLFTGKGTYLSRPDTGLTLRDLGGGRLTLRWDGPNPSDATFVRKDPPRFPRPPSAADKVRFSGVYSTYYGRGNNYYVRQLWVWESGDRRWAKYLHQGFTRGQPARVNGGGDFAIECIPPDCTWQRLARKDGSGDRVEKSGDTYVQRVGDAEGGTVIYRRGAIIPGLLYDRAPLSSEEENRRWLLYLPVDVTWTAPVAD